MAAPPARDSANYDYLIKLCLVGDSSYCAGAMGILPVYVVTDDPSFNNIRNWTKIVKQHASENVNKILVGNKADMGESKRAVPTSSGQALADEYGMTFFETSAKTNLNVEHGFFSMARDTKQRLVVSDTKAQDSVIDDNETNICSSTITPTKRTASEFDKGNLPQQS